MMTKPNKNVPISHCARRQRMLLAALLVGLSAAPSLARAEETDGVTNLLIELLVKKGILQQDDANALLAEAKAERKKAAKAAKNATTASATAGVAPPAAVAPV